MQEESEEKNSRKSEEDIYSARLNLYSMMAHFVAKKLNQRPNDILDNWCAPELIVAFGQYANEDAYKNYQDWKYSSNKGSVKKPSEYIVYFHGDI